MTLNEGRARADLLLKKKTYETKDSTKYVQVNNNC